MTTAITTVRVFISSPGDVAEEREQARRVLEGLQRLYPSARLMPVLWEDLALPATASFQQAIDFILEKEPIDVAVFILWSRLGSPLGPAITRKDGTPYRSGTEREFDLMLAAFEQSGHKWPVILAYSRQDEQGFHQLLSKSPEDRWRELMSQRELAKSFIQEQFHDAQGRNLRAYHSYPEPVSFAQRLHTHLRQVLDELLAAEAPRWPDNPYRGLQCFDLAHAAIFQGRDEETCDLLQRLRERAAAGCGSVVIVGASGSGKSSLARAGVAAALVQHSYEESGCWKVLPFIPSLAYVAEAGDARDHGLDLRLSLVRQMAGLVPGLNIGPVEELAADLAQSPEVTIRRGIVPALDRAGEAENQGPWRILIVLDQMEELWTDRRITAEQREQFLETLEALARSGRVALLATLRSDFYPAAQLSPTLLRLKEGCGHYDLLPPGAAALQRVIQEPARLAGVQFERGDGGGTLDQMLLEEATRSTGALPLLQYLLDELYQARDVEKRLLTLAAYKQLGGLDGALGQRVATVYAECPLEAQAALPELFSRLVSIDVVGDQLPVRRRALLADLRQTPARATMTDRLIAARFLTTDRQGEAAVASLAHEALLRCWERLTQWIRANRDQLCLRARIEQAKQRWHEAQCEPSLLLSAGLPLEEGRQFLSHGTLLTPSTAAFVQSSIDRDNTLRRRIRRTRRLVMSGLSLLTAAAVVASTLAMLAKQEADKQRGEAFKQRGEAVKQTANAKTALLRATKANERNEEQLHQASIAAHASAVKAWQEDDEARRQGRWVKSLSSVSKWHEAVVLWSRALELEPANSLASQWLYATLIHHGHDRSNMPGNVLRHESAINSANFSPDGTRIVTASNDNTARVWDAASGKPLGEPLRHEDVVNSANFSPDGTRVVTASDDDTARVWDVASGKPLGGPLRHENAVRSAHFSLDGTRVVTTALIFQQVWDAASGMPLGEPLAEAVPDHNFVAASFNPDGATVVTVLEDNTARIWDRASSKPLGESLRHFGPINSVKFGPDCARVVTASDDNTARVWDAASGKPLGEPLRHEVPVNSAHFSPDGAHVVTISDDNTARIWHATSGKPLGEPLRHEGRVESANFSADCARLVTVTTNTAHLWDAASGKPLGEPLRHDNAVSSADFSPDGSRVVTISDGTARVWDAASGIQASEPLRHQDRVNWVDFSPDGTRVVTASDDKTARLWDAANRIPMGEAMHHEAAVCSAAFSPDGARVVTASYDETARVWDAASGKPLGEPLRHQGAVFGASFSPDGVRVVTSSWDHKAADRAARIWDAASGKPLEMPHYVNSANFSSDGVHIVTALRTCPRTIPLLCRLHHAKSQGLKLKSRCSIWTDS